MLELIHSIVSAARSSLAQRNWYAALAVAVSLPDQCGFLDSGDSRTKTRYVAWFNTWLASKFVHKIGADFAATKVVFLNGDDLYALRCALLHQGSGDIDQQSASKILTQVHFVFPDVGPAEGLHLYRHESTLYVQVDRLVSDICDATDRWLAANEFRPEVQERAMNLAKFRPVSSFAFRGQNNFGALLFKDREEAERNGVFFPGNWTYFRDKGSG